MPQAVRKGHEVRKPPPEWCGFFLAMLILEGTIAAAAREAGVAYQTVMKYRRHHPEFAEQIQTAVELNTQRLEQEAQRRATKGVERGIYFRGQIVGKEVTYSDQLLIFLLKSRRPDVYRESQTQVSVNAQAAAGIQQNAETIMVVPDADRRAEVAKILSDALASERRSDTSMMLPAPEE